GPWPATETNTRDLIEPFARLVRAMPEHDLAIELQDLRFQRMQLGTQSCDTGTCHLRDSFVFRIGEDIEELFEAFAADRRHDAKLGKVGADLVDHPGHYWALSAGKKFPVRSALSVTAKRHHSHLNSPVFKDFGATGLAMP